VQDGVARGGECDPALAYVNGRIWFARGRWSAAAKWFGRAEDWGFEPVKVRYWRYRAVVNRSLQLVDAGRASEAADQLKALLAEQPGHPEERVLLVNLATALWRIQEPKSATKILDDLIAKAPGGADTYLVLGMILESEHDLVGAKKRLREAMLHASASYGDKTYRDALLRLSEVEVKLEDFDGAEAAAKQFLQMAKDDPDGLVALGTVLQARHDLEGAVLNFRRAARLQSGSMNTLVRLKQVLSGLGENAEAEEVGRRIDELSRRREQELRDEGATPTFR
jgi:tetratricopeptide (TPR) repeat protein